MPELPLCAVCHKPIRETEDFVIPEKLRYPHDPETWTRVHVPCYVPEGVATT